MNASAKRVALVTGAASGLGWALCQQLAPHCRLLMTDINAQLLTERAATLGARAQAADITTTEGQAVLLGCLQSDFGQLDYLINCAGITHRSLAANTRPCVFRKVMAVDYQAPVELSLQCLPLLKQSRGKIVNISSMAGWMPVLARAGYCAAKSAMNQFFETLRCEIKRDGIRVLMVYPSFLDTPIETNALGGDGNKARHRRSMIGKMRSPEWMAVRIWAAMQTEQERLFPDGFTRMASLLYALAPAFFLKRMSQKFASELNPPGTL
ncbi:SDR family NAD(P)-dependent oxidoreductase [Simiduia sp. 21SJ11W-1]|uniref:SDR family NAD(P)-dependent oxidoreductase n=1 Tax=Simiduia sp. 21SJ11W-1 TaxID=2909669 RepID=UPI0020A08D37|nr:SDR family NAD(P)-dependent oxidoreductase [Simiduia sp. 21SJ11W-1]UTA46876.1 SDR family NAD(P)-dependent oxidoreductase [Simiduia sp. 21SJ11W-1]